MTTRGSRRWAALAGLTGLTGLTGLIGLILVLTLGRARADAADEISRLIDRGQISRAISASAEALAAEPANAQLHHLRAQLLIAVADYPAAIGASLRASELSPKSAEVWAELALARTLAGDEAGAGEALRRALELEPEHPGALALERELALREQIRRHDKPPAPERPEAALFALLDGVRRGVPAAAAEAALAPDLLAELLGHLGASGRSEASRDRALMNFLRAYRDSTLGAQSVPGGFMMYAAEELAEGRARAKVDLLWTRVLSGVELTRLRRLLGEGKLGRFLAEERRAVLAGLDPVDLSAYFTRQANVPEVLRFQLAAELARDDGGHWRVRELAVTQADERRLSLSDVLLDWEAFARQAGVTPLPRAKGPGGRRWLWALAAVALLAGSLVLVVWRRRRASVPA